MSIRLLEFPSPSWFSVDVPPATVFMDPVMSSISRTFGFAEVVNSSVSSARAPGGIAIMKDRSSAIQAAGFRIVVMSVLLIAWGPASFPPAQYIVPVGSGPKSTTAWTPRLPVYAGGGEPVLVTSKSANR